MIVVDMLGRGALAGLVQGRRQALGLTRHALARRAGIGKGTLTAIEEGRTVSPEPATLAALARALDLPLAALQATLPPTPAAPQAGRGPGAPGPSTCLGCGRPRGEARQAFLVRAGARRALWLCHDCAQNDASVAALVAAYRRARVGGG